MPDREMLDRLEALFFEVLELPENERPPFLARRCAGDAVLRRSLERMLQTDREGGGLIDAAPWSAEVLRNRLGQFKDDDPLAKPGSQVGPYTLMEPVGVGGMGTVWLARRTSDEFHQRVALKLIKRGLDTDDILRRFRSERKILGQLEHPNIARLIDGGATSDGRPYLVMEFVDGEPIDRWCDRPQLPIRDRLQLFRTVCAAVQYAHGNLIVHRDLKPGNILINSEGQPKLLDFGLAKILRADADHEMSVTQENRRILTPRYASPEQMRGETLTTASDVYSLGVILYELLTGRSPYDPMAGGRVEFEKAVLEHDITRPSAAIQLSDGLRSTSMRRLQASLRGDLDNIVLTALQKNPARRYASAALLADDIDRHLRGLPVSAAPDSFAYRASRFVRRNKGVVAGLGVATFALVAGAAASTLFALRAYQAQIEAEHRTKIAESINEFLNEDILASADPGHTPDPDLTVREALQRAAQGIDKRFADQPIVEAAIRQTIGETYRGLRLPGEAVPHYRRAAELRTVALGELHSDTRSSKRELMTALFENDQFEEAKALSEELLAQDIEVVGTESADVMETRFQIAQFGSGDMEADIEVYRELLVWFRAHHGVSSSRTLAVMHSLANLYLQKNRTLDAEPLIEEIWEVTRSRHQPSDPETLDAMLGRALFYGRTDRLQEAVTILQEAVDILKETRPPNFADTGIWLTHLGIHLREQERFEEAEQAFLEGYQILAASLGPDIGWTKGTARFLYELYNKQGNDAEAEVWRARSTEADTPTSSASPESATGE